MRAVPSLVALLFVALPLAGCLSTPGAVHPDGLSTASATAGLPFPAASAFVVNGDDGKPLAWSLTVEKGPYHASGHADGPALEKVIEEIGANRIMPVHTGHPEWFEQRWEDRLIKVKEGQAAQVG